MSQITTGVRAILSVPVIYELSQKFMGADRVRKMLVNDYIRPLEGMRVLDIGCGPADILEYFSEVDYYGFDISESYIERARGRFDGKGLFFAKHLTEEDIRTLPKFDLVLMFGVLHHMDDSTSSSIIRMIYDTLKSGGRLITIDPVFAKGQNPIAKVLIRADRGQSVRTGNEYCALVESHFDEVKMSIHHQSFIPYTHGIMECVKQ